MQHKKEGLHFDMIYSELSDAVGKENISTNEVDKYVYSVDYYWVPRIVVDRGGKPETADFILYPQNTQQISKVMEIANYYKIPVTVWGGGSGSQGGALPIYGGIILDMKRMNKVLKINNVAYTATAETGIIQQDFEWEVNKKGYSLMHLPASISCATLGGFLAHRGTGVLSTKYGKVEDLIVNMEVVLPTGEIINTLEVPRHASGPDLNQLFTGSEGVFGVITKATLKMFDLPESRNFHAFMFNNLHDAYEAGREIMTRRLNPSVIRLYDEEETKHHVKRVLGLDREGAYLVFGFDGDKEIVNIQNRRAMEICIKTAYEDLGSEAGFNWWDNKYKFFYPPYAYDIPQAFGTMDTVATYDKMEKVYWGMKNAIENNYDNVRFIAHFSHWYEWGVMCYDRFIIEDEHVPRDYHEAIRLYNDIWKTGVSAALENGGIINEHHGIGIKLGKFMKEQYGPAFKVLQVIKKGLDPNNIMNPGKAGL